MFHKIKRGIYEEVKEEVKVVLAIWADKPLPVEILQHLYRQRYNKSIPYSELGFEKLDALLKTMSDISIRHDGDAIRVSLCLGGNNPYHAARGSLTGAAAQDYPRSVAKFLYQKWQQEQEKQEQEQAKEVKSKAGYDPNFNGECPRLRLPFGRGRYLSTADNNDTVQRSLSPQTDFNRSGSFTVFGTSPGGGNVNWRNGMLNKNRLADDVFSFASYSSNESDNKNKEGSTNPPKPITYPGMHDAVPEFAVTSLVYRLDAPMSALCLDDGIPIEKMPPKFSTVRINIIEVTNPTKFHFILASNVVKLRYLTDEMTEFYTSKPVAEYAIVPMNLIRGLVCAVSYYGKWYRVKIVELIYLHEVRIYYLDYGITTVMDKSSLKHLDRRFAKFPTQALKGRLANIKPADEGKGWTNEATMKFFNLIDKALIKAQITSFCADEAILKAHVVPRKGKWIHVAQHLDVSGLGQLHFEKDGRGRFGVNPMFK